MTATPKALYDTDTSSGLPGMAELLREGRFEDVDLEHLAEEIGERSY